MVEVTYEWLVEHTYRGVGLKKKQGKILGLTYPLKKGWKQKAVGTRLSDEDAERFAELGSHPKRKNAVNRNNDREFLGKRRRPAKERKEEYGNTARYGKAPFPETSLPAHSLTFDALDPVDMSVLSRAV